MAVIPANDWSYPYKGVGPTVLQASTTITSSTNTDALEVGRGMYLIEIIVSAITEGPTGTDIVVFWPEVNTRAATSTYEQCGCSLSLGDAAGVGIDLGGTGTYQLIVNNPRDNGIRLGVYIVQSTSSLTYSANIYPLRDKGAV